MKIIILISFCLIILHSSNICNALDSLEKISYDIAQKQLEDYNKKNLDDFLSAYTDDVQVFQFPDSLLYTGIDKMREAYKNFFERSPNVICRLINRIVNGRYVIDFESISNHYSGIDFEAVAIYEITNGKIRKVWFLPRKNTYQK